MFYNTKKKIYPNGYVKCQTFSRAIFNPDGDYVRIKNSPIPSSRLSRPDSSKRAIDKVFDIAMLNPFDYFVTFTLSSDKVDRYDYKVICSKFKNWLHNQSKRKSMIYLIIPELHKDGAVHFHGLISGNFSLVDSGKSYGGKVIYNLFDWGLGFSTCIRLDGDYLRTVRYICKYISKDGAKLFGNYYYAGGKGLVRECPVEYSNVDYALLDAKEYLCGTTPMRVKYY